MIRRFVGEFCTVLCAMSFATQCMSATVEFGATFSPLPYSEDGLTFTDVTGNSPAVITGFSGDMELVGGTNSIPIHVRATGLTPFNLLSLDIKQLNRTWRIESSSGAMFNPTTTGTINFTAMSGWAEITYFDIIHSPAAANGSIRIDNVSFNLVPEPSVLAFACMSFFSLAWAATRWR